MSKKKSKKKASKKKASKKVAVESYRHESATRKNIPTAKIAAEGTVPRVVKATYSYSAHLSPELRFDAFGQSDRVTDIVEKAAAGNKLTKEEAEILRGVAANASQPWLEWSGKKQEHDRGVLEVEPVALHIHERVSANAIIRAAKREDVQADLFADPKQDYKEAIQFYKHDVDWANRLILGDSLEVMSSLAKREDLAGKVQMIYLDPPYGIKFGSNFQPTTSREEVKDQDSHLTREIEMVQAYRDTWHLGVHSYLSYLRDRLYAARELLNQKGAIFLQISDANIHRVRVVMDEVFGEENAVTTIVVKKKGGQKGGLLEAIHDYVLFYAKDKVAFKESYNALSVPMEIDEDLARTFRLVELPNGDTMTLGQLAATLDEDDPAREDVLDLLSRHPGCRLFKSENSTSGGIRKNQSVKFRFQGREFDPGLAKGNCWKHTAIDSPEKPSGMRRVAEAGRLYIGRDQIGIRRYHDDFGRIEFTAWWDKLGGASNPIYVVQTNEKIIERCILMSTQPGDLVLDPTCGSGTTAYAAEKWGRRWITIDSSRVSVSLARQRMLTSGYDYYELKDSAAGPSGGFVCATAPHITSSVVANCSALDDVVEQYREPLDALLSDCTDALSKLGSDTRKNLLTKVEDKQKRFGKRSITTGDELRWALPDLQVGFEHWTVPFDVDPDFPAELAEAVASYRDKVAEKKAIIRECIESSAESDELVNEPIRVPNIVRVAGPFAVEGVRPEELSLDENSELFDPTPNEFEINDGHGGYASNASAYLDRMLQLISQDGVTFPNNEHRKFALLERLEETDSTLHAEALWEGAEDSEPPNIAIAFGPQHGPVTASQVEDLIRASRRYDELVIAAFSFDGSAQAVIQESANPRLKIHMAHIRPDISPGMDGLLKDSPKSQLFTVFGQPEIELRKEDGEVKVELLGVDIYSPLTGEITSSGAKKVAAWFLDRDYDGRCFCITQAFFPNQKAWDKIAKALGSSADAGAFDAYSSTISVPFEPGEHERIAVKVIDPRGNEVMAIRSLKDYS